jgi:hypothetical protein
VLVETQAPGRGVDENALPGVLDVVLDDVVYPLVSRKSTLALDELCHAEAVVFVRAAYYPLHGQICRKYHMSVF